MKCAQAVLGNNSPIVAAEYRPDWLPLLAGDDLRRWLAGETLSPSRADGDRHFGRIDDTTRPAHASSMAYDEPA